MWFVLAFIKIFLSCFFLEQRAEFLSSGELAEIYGTPKKIDFGMIPVLQPSSQTLTLFNTGLVPVDFRIKIVSTCGAVFQGIDWSVAARTFYDWF